MKENVKIKENDLIEISFTGYDGKMMYSYLLIVKKIDTSKRVFETQGIKTIYAEAADWEMENRGMYFTGNYGFEVFDDVQYNIKIMGQAEDYPEYIV
jgi:hypothetical protein